MNVSNYYRKGQKYRKGQDADANAIPRGSSPVARMLLRKKAASPGKENAEERVHGPNMQRAISNE